MKKWITYTLGILLTLVVLAAVAGMSYRMGFARGSFAAQNPGKTRMQFPQFANPHGFEKDFNQRGPNSQDKFFGGRGHDRDRGGMHFFSPIFGLVKLAVLALILWGGYALYKKSGWQFVRVDAPIQNQPFPSTIMEEKKTRRKAKS